MDKKEAIETLREAVVEGTAHHMFEWDLISNKPMNESIGAVFLDSLGTLSWGKPTPSHGADQDGFELVELGELGEAVFVELLEEILDA